MSDNTDISPGAQPLDGLRRELDRIDDTLHDLLMERAGVVEQVAAAKGVSGLPVIHPGREVEILRRLNKRHRGRLPFGVIARMWREMLCGTIFMQGPCTVAVHAADDNQGVWDLARDHFGSHSEMVSSASPRDVLHQVMTGAATVGVLPMPGDQDRDPWWPNLCLADAPHVYAKLPFAGAGNARGPQREALVVGRIAAVGTGEDRSMIVVETAEAFSRDGLGRLLREAGLEPARLVSIQRGGWMHLAETEGFLDAEDGRLASLRGRDGVTRVVWVGAYGKPLDIAAGAGT